MTRPLSYAVLAACVLIAPGVAGQQSSSQQTQQDAQPTQPTFRGGSDTVRVFVTVTDRDGRLATTLTQSDFEVRDEGRPQPITTFDNSPRPIRLIVMLDVSGSMEGNLPLLREAADELFMRLGPSDRARVGAFGREVVISESFTRDPKELRSALPEAIDPQAPTPLWRGIDEAMKAFGKDVEERRVVLVLSDGKDSGFAGPISFARDQPRERIQRVASQAEVIERARDQDVMIYAIGMRSRGSRPMQPGVGIGGLQATMAADLPDPGLARVAEDTGGGYLEIRFGQDLGAAFARVADELHSQYLIGFAPPKRDGKVHEIDVRLTQKGLKPRARRSYVAAKESTSTP
jgi:Ca-activated chloride channel homolog